MESSRDSWAAPEAAQRRRSIHIVCREPSQELEKLEAEDLYVPPGVRASSPPREPVRRCNTITRPPPPRRGSTEEGKDSLDQAAKLRRRLPDIGNHTLAGNRYLGVNQDFCVVQELYSHGEIPLRGQQCYVVALTDGHGILGCQSAMFAAKALARAIFSGFLRNKHLARMDERDVIEEIKAAFRKANTAANNVYETPPKTITYPASKGSKLATWTLKKHESGMWVYKEESGKGVEKMLECGCTCTAAIIQGKCVYLADVGDSGAVLGWRVEGGEEAGKGGGKEAGKENGKEGSKEAAKYKGEFVTVRHSGHNKEELERMRTHHAATTKMLSDGYLHVLEGPCAGYELSVTRALGHKGLEACGVLQEPFATMLHLEDKHCCLVLASDGLWDVMQADTVVADVMASREAGLSAQAAAQGLVERAVALGLAGPQGKQDNTSAIVVFL